MWCIAMYLDDNWQEIFMSSIAPEPGWGIE